MSAHGVPALKELREHITAMQSRKDAKKKRQAVRDKKGSGAAADDVEDQLLPVASAAPPASGSGAWNHLTAEDKQKQLEQQEQLVAAIQSNQIKYTRRCCDRGIEDGFCCLQGSEALGVRRGVCCDRCGTACGSCLC